MSGLLIGLRYSSGFLNEKWWLELIYPEHTSFLSKVTLLMVSFPKILHKLDGHGSYFVDLSFCKALKCILNRIISLIIRLLLYEMADFESYYFYFKLGALCSTFILFMDLLLFPWLFILFVSSERGLDSSLSKVVGLLTSLGGW